MGGFHLPNSLIHKAQMQCGPETTVETLHIEFGLPRLTTELSLFLFWWHLLLLQCLITYFEGSVVGPCFVIPWSPL